MKLLILIFLFSTQVHNNAGELLGKSRKQILKIVKNLEYKDTFYNPPQGIVRESISVNKYIKWNTLSDILLQLDSNGTVIFVDYYFLNLDMKHPENMWMTYKNRMEALEDLTHRFGKPGEIKDRYSSLIYHWQVNKIFFELAGIEPDIHSNYP